MYLAIFETLFLVLALKEQEERRGKLIEMCSFSSFLSFAQCFAHLPLPYANILP